MNIGIIGAGHIGRALAHQFTRAGHAVALSNSRGPDTVDLSGLDGVRAVTAQEAAEFGELVVETVPFAKVGELPISALAGKIVIDTANYYPGRDGQLDLGGLSEAAWVARQLPGARVVKAFNAIHAQQLHDFAGPDLPTEQRRAIYVASDDAEAKQTVTALIESLGFGVVDGGSLADSTRFQPGTAVYGPEDTVQSGREKLAQQQ